jgi:hypothetical protein
VPACSGNLRHIGGHGVEEDGKIYYRALLREASQGATIILAAHRLSDSPISLLMLFVGLAYVRVKQASNGSGKSSI